MDEQPDVVDTEELVFRIEKLEYEVIRARRAAETTRTIAIAFAVLFLGLPLIGLLFNMARAF